MRSFSLVSLLATAGLFASAAMAIDRRGFKESREEGDYPYPDIYYKVDGLEGINATTTNYNLLGTGACGCGKDGTAFSFVWGVAEYHTYFAAASMSIFANGRGDAGWCGPGCGLCFEANNTGISATGGYGGEKGKRILIVVNDLCPPGQGNEDWCPVAGQTNIHDSQYHFDIRGDTNPLGDNVKVDFKQIRCPEPITELRQQCECNVNKSVDGDDPQAKYVHHSKY